jgi:tryptophan halogenase
MIHKLDKIVVVGGGSAGWMSAAFLKRAYPHREIVVIESPNVPTVGVGESTLGGINNYLRFLQLDEIDFMRNTDAVYKMSIKFTDFYKKGDDGFHYPFGIPYENGVPMFTWLVKKALYPETPIDDFVRCFFPATPLFENNKFDLNERGLYDSYDSEQDVAYQFDAIKFAAYLREKYCKTIGVHHIPATIVKVNTNENGVESLVLDSGDVVTGDLYVDCTGFKALLIGEALGEKFVSYEDMLPNNRSWAAQVPYKNKELEMEAFTNCTGLGNGWVWNTPIWSRLGTGYVYSDKFISSEDALKEFKAHLMSDRMVVPRTKKDLESIKFRDVPFKIGHFENTFVKNVVAIGLSAGFIEPLESNGLYTVHEFLFQLQKFLQRDSVNQLDKDVYNEITSTLWKRFCNFVAMHYRLSLRDDTPYWIASRSKSFITGNQKISAIEALSNFKSNIESSSYSAARLNHPPIDGINWIAVGMRYFYLTLPDYEVLTAFKGPSSVHLDAINELEKRKARWAKIAKNAPGILEYHLKNIYSENL